MGRGVIHIFNEKRDYVEKMSEAFIPLTDFTSLEYMHDNATDSEYIRIKSVIGEVFYINVTGNSTEAIFKEVCRIALGGKPTGLIVDRAALRQIALLFDKQEAVIA